MRESRLRRVSCMCALCQHNQQNAPAGDAQLSTPHSAHVASPDRPHPHVMREASSREMHRGEAVDLKCLGIA